MIETVFLTRRNLLTLLSKLDRKAAGEQTMCTIVKNQRPAKAFQQTMDMCQIVAVEDEEYYKAIDSEAGIMHPSDDPMNGVKEGYKKGELVSFGADRTGKLMFHDGY